MKSFSLSLLLCSAIGVSRAAEPSGGSDRLEVETGTVTIPASPYSAVAYRGFTMWISQNMQGVWTLDQLHATGVRSDNQTEKSGKYVYNWFNNNIGKSDNPIPSTGAIGYEGWVWCDGADGTVWTFALDYGDKNLFYLYVNYTKVWEWDNNNYQNVPRVSVAMRHGWNRFVGITKKGWTATGDGGWTAGLTVCKSGNSSSSGDYAYLQDAGDGKTIVYETGDETLDGHPWRPKYTTLSMAGGVLDLSGQGYSFAAFEGAGTTIQNGDVTLTGDWTVDCTSPASLGTTVVAGTLTFGADTKIVLANLAADAPSFDLTLVSAGAAINRIPTVEATGDTTHEVTTTRSADGKSLTIRVTNKRLEVGSGTVKIPFYSAAKYYGFTEWISQDMQGVWTFDQLHATGTSQNNQHVSNGLYTYYYFNVRLDNNNVIPSTGAIGYEGWLWCDGPDGTEWTFALCYGAGDTFTLQVNDTSLFNFNHKGNLNAADTPRYNVAMKHGWNRFRGMTKKGWTGVNSKDNLWTKPGLCIDTQGRKTSNCQDYVYIGDTGNGQTVVSEVCDVTQDGSPWRPKHSILAMSGGALDLDGGDYSFAAFEGTGTAIQNGDVTLTGNWTVDCTSPANLVTTAVAGTLTFGVGTKIVLENLTADAPSFDLALVSAGKPLNRRPAVEATGDTTHVVTADWSADGKSLTLHVRLIDPADERLTVSSGTVKIPTTTYSAVAHRGYTMWISQNMQGIWTLDQLHATGVRSDNQTVKDGKYVYNWFNNNINNDSVIPSTGAIGYEGWVWCDGPDGTQWTFALSYGDANKFYLYVNYQKAWEWNNADWHSASRVNVTMRHGWNRFVGITKKGWTATADTKWSPIGLSVDMTGVAGTDCSKYAYLQDAGDGKTVVYETGDEVLDGHSWKPNYTTLAMAGGVLDLESRNHSFAAFEGTGTSIQNGDVTLTGDWTVDCTSPASLGTTVVAGTLAFGADTKIVLANLAADAPSFDLTLVSAGQPLNRLPTVVAPSASFRTITAELGADGKSIVIHSVYAPPEFAVEPLPATIARKFFDAVKPRPAVTDKATGVALTEGTDFTYSYSGDAKAFGPHALTVQGMGQYANCTKVVNYEVVGSVTAVLVPHRQATATVTFAAADESRKLYVAYGTSDGGDEMSGWQHSAVLATVPAGVTSLADLQLPEAVGATDTSVRFFLDTTAAERAELSTDDYASGTVLNYDGIENVGKGQHADSPRTWANVGTGGSTYDLTLPSSVAAADGMAFVSTHVNPLPDDRPVFESVSGINTSKGYTIEVVSKFLGWKEKDNYANLQYVLSTPRGLIGYRQDRANGYFICTPASDWPSKWTLENWWPSNDDGKHHVSDIHTLASPLHGSRCQAYFDGVETSDHYNDSSTEAVNTFRFFRNARGDIEVYAMRVYNREITVAELARNAQIDAIRFKKIPMPSAPIAFSRPLTFKVRRSDPAYADVSCAAVGQDRDIYVVWGDADCGTSPDAWPHKQKVGTLAAGAVASSVVLPEAARGANAGRIVLSGSDSSDFAVSEMRMLAPGGLILVVGGERPFPPEQEQTTEEVEEPFDNSGFENGLTGWTHKTTASSDSTVFHSGSKSACLNITESKDWHLTIDLPIVDEADYAVTCFARTENLVPVAGDKALGCRIIAEWYDENGKWFASGANSHHLEGTTDWTQLTCSGLKAPEGAAKIRINLAVHGNGKAWFDDVRLVRVETPIKRVSPAHGVTLNNNCPAFAWEPHPGVRAYRLELSQDPTFAASNVRTYEVGGLHEYQLTEPLGPGIWHWKVTAEGVPDPTYRSFRQTAEASRDCLPPLAKARGCRVLSADDSFEVDFDSADGVVAARFGDVAGTRVSTSGSVTRYRFMPPPGGWTAVLTEATLAATDGNGNRSEKTFWLMNAPKPSNDTVIGSDGSYLVGGQKTYPTGIFEVSPEFLGDVRAAGFDVVHEYLWERNRDNNACREYLDQCWAAGLRAFIGFDRGRYSDGGIIRGDFAHVARRVGALATHPGLFCWYLFDEPERLYQFASPDLLKEMADFLRTLDPYHAVVLSTWKSRMGDYREAWDSHWTQAYGTPEAVTARIDEHRGYLAGKESPISLILNCVDEAQTAAIAKGTTPDPAKFEKDYDYMRASAFLGIVKQCNGLFWWWYAKDDPKYYTAAHCPAAWSNLSNILQEIAGLRAELTADGTVTTDKSDTVEWLTKTVGGSTVTIAVNASTSSKTVTINGKSQTFGRYGVEIIR